MPEKYTWWNILVLCIGSMGGGWMIALFLLKWKRYRPLDAAIVDEKKAQIAKIRTETEISIVSEYRVLVQQLRTALDDVQKDLMNEKRLCEELEGKLNDALRDIKNLKQKIDECEKLINKKP